VSDPIRVVIAEDHPTIRFGLCTRLSGEPDMEVVGEAQDGTQALRLCKHLQPDVLVLDLDMPGPAPTETVGAVQEHNPHLAVLLLAAFDGDAFARDMIASGVAGYVLKDEALVALVDAVRSVAHGGTWLSRKVAVGLARPRAGGDLALSRRERELLRLLVRGWDNSRIARELVLGEQTVRNYLSHLYSKLDVHSRGEAIVWAHRNRVTDWADPT